MARGFNATQHTDNRYLMRYAHTYINEGGEDPIHVGLSTPAGLRNIRDWGPENDTLLVRYLRFYDIGKEFIDEGDELKIKEGKRDAAKTQLRQYLSIL
ncbi:hypothetical protein FRC08_014067 [Ceratobasidium sp. 394]|nr:hypothetical protein FRC08_014067 [Ceratobasidium sp. 394]